MVGQAREVLYYQKETTFSVHSTDSSNRNLHPRVKVDQAGRPLPPKEKHFDRLSVETDISA